MRLTSKQGYKYLLEKTEYLMNIKEARKYTETKYERMGKVAKFKYTGEVSINGVNKEVNLVIAIKMERAFQLTNNLYKIISFY